MMTTYFMVLNLADASSKWRRKKATNSDGAVVIRCLKIARFFSLLIANVFMTKTTFHGNPVPVFVSKVAYCVGTYFVDILKASFALLPCCFFSVSSG